MTTIDTDIDTPTRAQSLALIDRAGIDVSAHTRDCDSCASSYLNQARDILSSRPASDLRAGDVVQLTGGDWEGLSHPAAGKLATVTGEGAFDGMTVITEYDGNRQTHYVNSSWPYRFIWAAPEEATTETTPEPEGQVTLTRAEYERLKADAEATFSQYDERLRPMFVNAARVANAAGFCSEYDRIARAVGAPERNEILAEETAEFNLSVEVTYTMRRTITMRIEAPYNADEDWDLFDLDSSEVEQALDAELREAGLPISESVEDFSVDRVERVDY